MASLFKFARPGRGKLGKTKINPSLKVQLVNIWSPKFSSPFVTILAPTLAPLGPLKYDLNPILLSDSGQQFSFPPKPSLLQMGTIPGHCGQAWWRGPCLLSH